MASIVKRNKSCSVVYYVDGVQKWETFPSEELARARKKENEEEKSAGTFIPPNPKIVEEFLNEYIEIYGTTHWGHSSFCGNVALIQNYIIPNIGKRKIYELTVKQMDTFFNKLKTQKAVQQDGRGDPGYISDRCIHDINQLLSNAFSKAVDWGYMKKNPITKNACPKRKDRVREIWNPETARKALNVCTDMTLLVCMHLAIACSMRIGEISGLRWQFVSFDEENEYQNAMLTVDSQLQRISREAYEKLMRKKNDIRLVFPALKKNTKTMLVLKTLKTSSSNRVVWLPPTTVSILLEYKKLQDSLKNQLGEEYQDYDLVVAQDNGRPMESHLIEDKFKELIETHGFPKVDFHSLRHLSATVKLIISHGDVKGVQGDTGHSYSKMVTDRYAHILDENRKRTAQKFEKEFYGGDIETKTGSENEISATPQEKKNNTSLDLTQLLVQCIKNPELAEKLKEVFSAI